MFGEGFELERVKGVFSAAHVLHSVFSSAALAEETQQGGGGVHRHNENKNLTQKRWRDLT